MFGVSQQSALLPIYLKKTTYFRNKFQSICNGIAIVRKWKTKIYFMFDSIRRIEQNLTEKIAQL